MNRLVGKWKLMRLPDGESPLFDLFLTFTDSEMTRQINVPGSPPIYDVTPYTLVGTKLTVVNNGVAANDTVAKKGNQLTITTETGDTMIYQKI